LIKKPNKKSLARKYLKDDIASSPSLCFFKETESWHKENQIFRTGTKGQKIKRSKVKLRFKEENQKEGKEIQ
jgi:hypothetical protein